MSAPRPGLTRVHLDGGPFDPLRQRCDGPARPAARVRMDLDDATQVALFVGADLAHDPRLAPLVDAARASGRSPHVALLPDAGLTEGPPADVLHLPLHGAPEDHDLRVGAPGSAAAAAALLASGRRVRVHSQPLSPSDGAAVAHAVADRAEALHLRGPVDGPTLKAVVDALGDSATSLHLDGVHAPPDVTPGPPTPLTAAVIDARAQGGWWPGLAGGVTPVPDALRPALHALGLAAPPPPRALPAPRGPVVVLAPGIPDVLLATSTLPGLVRALQDRGVDARLESVWAPPWNLHGPGAMGATAAGTLDPTPPERAAARLETARRLNEAFLDRLDLRGVDTIIAPGWAAAWRALQHRTCPASARVVALDLHLCAGIEPLRDHALGGALSAVSCFPAFWSMYVAAGVDPYALVWAPYPVDLVDLPPGPDPTTSDVIVAAGSHLRDHGLLAAVADALPAGLTLRVHGASAPPHPRIDARGTVGLDALCRSLREARAVVVAARSSSTDAAGISVTALALAAGRPVIATPTWGAVDHLRHGVDGLLAAPDALPAAVAAVAQDDALTRHLAGGARLAAARADTATLAATLCGQPATAWPPRDAVRAAELEVR